jgi:sigma-B regulation protein RsbU (phosphoserine phosphatase)
MVDDPLFTRENFKRLQKDLAQRETQLAIINSVQEGLAAHLEVQQIYNLVGDRVREITNAQVVMISNYDRASDTIEHRYAIESNQRIIYPGRHPCGGFRSRIIESGQPYLVNTHVAEEAARMGQPTIPGTVTPKSWLGVPMFVGGQVSGVLSLQNLDYENAFNKSDIRLLQTLANSMSVALENARLWEEEHLYRQALEHEFQIGRKIQTGFLPETLPELKGWEIAARLQPAREVAGDFYDVFPLPHGKLALILGDVCDKGLGAALFMTLFRSLLRAGANINFYTRQEVKTDPSVNDCLKNAVLLTNNYIAETHGETGMFATLFFGVLDPKNGTLAYINAGQQPPVLLHPDCSELPLTRTGPAMGVFPDIEYAVERVTLKTGDVLLAYTDGLTEATNPQGELFDPQTLWKLFEPAIPLQTSLDQILSAHQEFSQLAVPLDDITLLAIRGK